MIRQLMRWSRTRSRRATSRLRITVHTRAGCTCCQKAIELLRRYQRNHGFSIEEIDVDTDPTLAERYNTEIPVITIDGKVRFRGIVNPALFERLLIAEGRNR
ncbi:MAG: hypothetical protein NVSMB9_01720 [Isosphaeraceae bacterium]